MSQGKRYDVSFQQLTDFGFNTANIILTPVIYIFHTGRRQFKQFHTEHLVPMLFK